MTLNSWSCSLYIWSAWIIGMHHHAWFRECWGWNPGLCACQARTINWATLPVPLCTLKINSWWYLYPSRHYLCFSIIANTRPLTTILCLSVSTLSHQPPSLTLCLYPLHFHHFRLGHLGVSAMPLNCDVFHMIIESVWGVYQNFDIYSWDIIFVALKFNLITKIMLGVFWFWDRVSSRFKGQPWQHSEFKASVGYMKPCLKDNNNSKGRYRCCL